jgi:hypothetical protein
MNLFESAIVYKLIFQEIGDLNIAVGLLLIFDSSSAVFPGKSLIWRS